MPYPLELSQWMTEVSSRLCVLSRSQAHLLAVFSYAVMMTQSCGLSHVAFFVARVLHQRENTVRQRLREFTYAAADKRGDQRREVVVRGCFVPLVRWVQELWCSEERTLVLALDATTLREVFTVLSISVMVGGCAIPVGWVIVRANQPGAWKPHWRALLATLNPGVPSWLTVYVLADQGLYAKWLYQDICRNGWHPLLRIKRVGYCVDRRTGQRWTLATLARRCQGRVWHGQVHCFQENARLDCTLLILWADGYDEPWLLLTDLAPTTVSPTWYALRVWIENGFKALKSAGFHWERTRMTDPARAERLWLVLAVAALRSVALAGSYSPPPPRCPVPEHLMVDRSPSNRPRYPRLNRLKQGALTLLASTAATRPFPLLARLAAPALPPPPLLEFVDL